MASRNPSQPNVLAILTDDHGHWAMGCAGNSEVRTPNLDRLAASGIRFENFFCASPVCSPARASLLTGAIPSQHGVHDWLRGGNTSDKTCEPEGNGRLIEYLKNTPGYTDILAENGYRCGLSGKWHLGDCHHKQKGFSFWEVHAKGGGPYYKAPMIKGSEVVRPEGYVTDVITDNALRFLTEEALSDDAPFCLHVNYTAPHSPWGREHHPPELWDDYHDNCPFHSTPDGLAPPAWAERLSIPVKDAETRRSHLSGYYAAITAMDAGVGRLLDWLEAQGLREDTLVFFTSDNGMSMGHHGVYGKGNATFPLNMFDSSVKVPAIMSRPGHVPHGIAQEALLSHYDIMPTLLDYLGFENPNAASLPGSSFADMLRGWHHCPPGEVVVFDEYGPVRMVRDRKWKYVHRYPYGPNELYDLLNDPDETNNLVDKDDFKQRAERMRGRLEAWFDKYVVPQLDGTHEGVTGRGQIGVVGPAAGGHRRFCD
jgi:arylsulfatase A-like enzyme